MEWRGWYKKQRECKEKMEVRVVHLEGHVPFDVVS